MGQHVNPTAFRLGYVTFWKTELYSKNNSKLFLEFFNLYRLLKLALSFVGFESISIKILKLNRINSALVLINFYRYMVFRRKRFNKKRRRRVVKKKLFRLMDYFNYSPIKKRKPKIKNLLNIKVNKLLIENHFRVVLKKPIVLHLRSIFKTPYSLILEVSKYVHQKAMTFPFLRHFMFLKDTINFINFSFMFLKSNLLANHIGKLLKSHKNVKFIANKVNALLSDIKFHKMTSFSLRVSLFGKTGRSSRSRLFSFSYGNHWPLQTIHSRLSYCLSQTWNVKGSFGVKVWIFNLLKKEKNKSIPSKFKTLKKSLRKYY